MIASVVSPLHAGAPADDDTKLAQVIAMYAEYRKDFPTVDDIDAKAAAALYAEGKAQFVDVRRPAEIAVSSLPGAIDKQSFLQNRQAYQHKTVVVFCTISYRSGVFARELADQGDRVVNLKGGILAWVLQGGRIEDQKGETRRLHVYGPKWDLAPADYETLTFGLLERLTP